MNNAIYYIAVPVAVVLGLLALLRHAQSSKLHAERREADRLRTVEREANAQARVVRAAEREFQRQRVLDLVKERGFERPVGFMPDDVTADDVDDDADHDGAYDNDVLDALATEPPEKESWDEWTHGGGRIGGGARMSGIGPARSATWSR